VSWPGLYLLRGIRTRTDIAQNIGDSQSIQIVLHVMLMPRGRHLGSIQSTRPARASWGTAASPPFTPPGSGSGSGSGARCSRSLRRAMLSTPCALSSSISWMTVATPSLGTTSEP
jgi:hypothetical protein